jgi:hypothetical protein
MKKRTEDKKAKVLAALLTSNSRKEAAKKAGVSESSIYDYLRDPDFNMKFTEAQGRILEDACNQIQRNLQPAITFLKDVVTDPRTSKAYRIQAARTIIEFSLKFSETVNFEKRLKAIEDAEDSTEAEDADLDEGRTPLQEVLR